MLYLYSVVGYFILQLNVGELKDAKKQIFYRVRISISLMKYLFLLYPFLLILSLLYYQLALVD